MSIKKYTNGSFVDIGYKRYETSTDTITTLPADIIADGQSATVGLVGNMSQTGTPTPQNPIQPQETGDLETTGDKTGQYKIPISSANTTTNVYLGEVQTTRKIAKYAFTGQENWQAASGFFYLGSILPDYLRARDTITYVCTHYIVYPQTGFGTNVPNKNLALGSGTDNQRVYVKDDDMADVTAFKSYLQQQYAAGTPVTVWYVLATETTGIVNEPLRKIGDYADTVSGITVPTLGTAEQFDILTTLKPSEVSLTYTGWHSKSDHKF